MERRRWSCRKEGYHSYSIAHQECYFRIFGSRSDWTASPTMLASTALSRICRHPFGFLVGTLAELRPYLSVSCLLLEADSLYSNVMWSNDQCPKSPGKHACFPLNTITGRVLHALLQSS